MIRIQKDLSVLRKPQTFEVVSIVARLKSEEPLNSSIDTDKVILDKLARLDTCNKYLRQYLYTHQCSAAGIAAVQTKWLPSFRLKHMKINDIPMVAFWDLSKVKVMLNPRILSHKGKGINDGEGCLSIPKKKYSVPRYSEVEVQWTNPTTLKLEQSTFFGYSAYKVQHEIDHTNGIVICDKSITEGKQ